MESQFLVVVDAHSKWRDVYHANGLKFIIYVRTLIEKLHVLFTKLLVQAMYHHLLVRSLSFY